MSSEWHRKYEISVPVERVWAAVINPDELGVLMSPPFFTHEFSRTRI